MDWTATLLAAGGAQADPDFPLDGEDLLPVLAGEGTVQDRTFLWRFATADQDAVRQGPWKYLREGEREHLFNLAEDVREQADYRELEPELLARLRDQFRSWDQTLLPKKATT